MMTINQVAGLPLPGVTASLRPLSQGQKVAFSDYLRDAVQSVVSTDAGEKLAGLGALTEGLPDIHTATIAAQKAEIALNLTIQIRNKIIEAYQEVVRMQV
jgi:flagellar hook-basal body complex protein FliE